MKQTEHQLMSGIMHYLRMRGWYCFRMNSGAMRTTDGKGKMRLVRMHEAGTPDLMAFKKCKGGLIHFDSEIHQHHVTKVIFLEVKVGKNKPTRLQETKMKELREYGAQCHVVYSISDVQELGL